MRKPWEYSSIIFLIVCAALTGGCVDFVTNSILIGVIDGVTLEVTETLTALVGDSSDDRAIPRIGDEAYSPPHAIR